MIDSLFPHQDRSLAELRARLLAGARRIVLQLPTGAGKTVIAATIIQGALRKGKRVLFTVPSIELVKQTIEAFEAEGILDLGVMQAAHERSDIRQPVQIASVQTLAQRQVPEFDIALIDEAHLRFKVLDRVMAERPNVPIVGLSATPWAKGLGKAYSDLIIGATTRELIDAGRLSPFRVFAPTHPDLSKVRTKGGDYDEADLSDAMDKQALVADIVDTWRRRGEGRPTLVFAVSRIHAKHLEEEFRAADITTGYIDGYSTPEERLEVAKLFRAGDIQVVCNVGVLTTGIDWDVRCIVLARPTKSEMLYVQIIGRGLRNAAGKTDLIVLDHSDTTTRLGLVTDIHHDELDDGPGRGPVAKRDNTPLPKECPSCKRLKPPKTPVCPDCGFKPEPRSAVEVEDGDLVEVTKGARAKADKGPKHFTFEEKHRIFGQLKFHGRAKGRKSGWAKHMFRDYTGVWPDRHLDAPELPMTQDLQRWVTARMIRFAKSKGAAHAR